MTPYLSQALACLGSELLRTQSRDEAGAVRGSSSGPPSAVNPNLSDGFRSPPTNIIDEAVKILERAISLIKAEIQDSKSGVARRAKAWDSGAAEGVGLRENGESARHQLAIVLDSLSEAYARGKRWEKARCTLIFSQRFLDMLAKAKCVISCPS